MAIDRDGSGRVRRARFAFGGVTASPILLREAENVVLGQIWNRSAVERVGQVLDGVLLPVTDHRASKHYRREICKSLHEKFWSDVSRPIVRKPLPPETAPARRKWLGGSESPNWFIFQAFNLIGELIVYENVELPLTYRGVPSSEQK